MKKSSLLLLTGAAVCVLSAVAVAAEPKDDILAAIKAQNEAPTSRMKINTVDPTGKMNATILLESVKPDGMHMKTEAGPVVMELVTDGKRTMMKQGATDWMEAPAAMASAIAQAKQNATMEAAISQAKDIKAAGHENVSGTASSIYTFNTDTMGMQTANRLWVSDKDHRPLKSEGQVKGEVAMGGASQKVDMKVTVAYDYDPSIKIVMPPAK